MKCGVVAVVNGRESPECGRERVEARREAAAQALLPMTIQAPPESVGATREMEPRRVWVPVFSPPVGLLRGQCGGPSSRSRHSLRHCAKPYCCCRYEGRHCGVQ